MRSTVKKIKASCKHERSLTREGIYDEFRPCCIKSRVCEEAHQNAKACFLEGQSFRGQATQAKDAMYSARLAVSTFFAFLGRW